MPDTYTISERFADYHMLQGYCDFPPLYLAQIRLDVRRDAVLLYYLMRWLD